MLTRLLPLVLALAVSWGTAPAAAADEEETPDSYAPRTGVKFNDPLGDEEQQRRLFIHIRRTVSSVPAGGVIRFAVFSFADKRVSRALLAAYERGVRVRLVFAGAHVYPPMERLRDTIGTDPEADSFVVICDNSCRGSRGEMHAKYFSFSRTTGGAKHVTMVGSSNLTQHNATEQWSDLYTVAGDRSYFRAYRHWFTQLKWDSPVEPTYVRKRVHGHRIDITPLSLEEEDDPIRTALSRIRCEVTQGDIDPDSPHPDEIVPTRIRIATSAWNEERGQAIARDVATLLDRGCEAKVFFGTGTGPVVRDILRGAGAELTNGTHRGVHTHEKLMVVRGPYGDDPRTFRVLTGSHNWSNRALGRDDLILQLTDPHVGRQYWEGFGYMWRNG